MKKVLVNLVMLRGFYSASLPLLKKLGPRIKTFRDDGINGGKVLEVGFTLIELLVVVLIIGILAAIALPKYQMAVYKTRFTNAMYLVNHYRDLEEAYFMANGHYGRLEDIGADFPSNCKYTRHDEWVYDVLSCPDYEVHFNAYGAVDAYIKKCPVGRSYCVRYIVPLTIHHSLLGERPSCVPQNTWEGTEAFGTKVCRMISGKEGVRIGLGMAYYLN